MLYGRRKNDLRFRLSEMLKLADKVVEFGRSTEKNLYQHRVIPCHAVTFHYVGTGTDIRIKFFFLYGLHLQIDKRFDVEPKRLRIDMRVIPCDKSDLLQSLDAGRDRGGRKEGFFRDVFNRHPRVALQKGKYL